MRFYNKQIEELYDKLSEELNDDQMILLDQLADKADDLDYQNTNLMLQKV